MRNHFATIVIVSVLLVFAINGCVPSRGARPGAEDGVKANQPEVEKSFNVKTVTVKRQDISSKLTLSGDVEASVSVDVYPEASGKLAAVYVETGSWVNRDQVLAKIDPSRPGLNYAESPVKAPIRGTVTAINADPGSTVSQQMPLVTIGDISRLVIKTGVPERFVYMIKKGQPAKITTTAEPGVEYQAKITSISPVINPVSRTLSVELSLIGETPIKAGMFVGIELITSTSENSLVVPEKAVLTRDEQTYVFRVNGEHVEKSAVSVGIKNGGLAEITSGLAEGDRIVLEGVSLVSDGSRVRILNNEENR